VFVGATTHVPCSGTPQNSYEIKIELNADIQLIIIKYSVVVGNV
jgi:hypothetical protein